MAFRTRIFERDQQLGYKAEAEEGVAETLGGSDYSHNIEPGWSIKSAPDLHARNPVGRFSRPATPVPGAQMGTFSFAEEMLPSAELGTPPPWYTLLQAAGFSISTNTATADGSNEKSLTIQGRNAIVDKTLRGARCAGLQIGAGKPGERVLIQVNGQGNYTQATHGAGAGGWVSAGLSYPTGAPHVLLGDDLLLAGTDFEYTSVSFEVENGLHALPSGDAAEGYAQHLVSGQKIRLKVEIPAHEHSVKNWYAAVRGVSPEIAVAWVLTMGTLKYTIGGTANLPSEPELKWNEGVGYYPIELEFNRNAAVTIVQAAVA